MHSTPRHSQILFEHPGLDKSPSRTPPARISMQSWLSRRSSFTSSTSSSSSSSSSSSKSHSRNHSSTLSWHSTRNIGRQASTSTMTGNSQPPRREASVLDDDYYSSPRFARRHQNRKVNVSTAQDIWWDLSVLRIQRGLLRDLAVSENEAQGFGRCCHLSSESVQQGHSHRHQSSRSTITSLRQEIEAMMQMLHCTGDENAEEACFSSPGRIQDYFSLARKLFSEEGYRLSRSLECAKQREGF